VTRLADSKPDNKEKAYWTVLNKLRTELARKLDELVQASFTQRRAPEPLRNGRKTVFLAETTQALMVDRDAVAAFLLDQGYDSCPTRFYSRDPAALPGQWTATWPARRCLCNSWATTVRSVLRSYTGL